MKMSIRVKKENTAEDENASFGFTWKWYACKILFRFNRGRLNQRRKLPLALPRPFKNNWTWMLMHQKWWRRYKYRYDRYCCSYFFMAK